MSWAYECTMSGVAPEFLRTSCLIIAPPLHFRNSCINNSNGGRHQKIREKAGHSAVLSMTKAMRRTMDAMFIAPQFVLLFVSVTFATVIVALLCMNHFWHHVHPPFEARKKNAPIQPGVRIPLVVRQWTPRRFEYKPQKIKSSSSIISDGSIRTTHNPVGSIRRSNAAGTGPLAGMTSSSSSSQSTFSSSSVSLPRRGLKNDNETSVDDPCLRQELFETDLLDQRVPGRTGLVFYLGSKSKGVTVRGIEVAVDSYLVENDWRVRIYVSDEKYEEEGFKVNMASYSKIADTTAILHPDGKRALIPTHALEPIEFELLQRKTIYIRTARPWLRYTRKVFTKAKHQAISDHNIVALFAGSPLILEDEQQGAPSEGQGGDVSSSFDDPSQEFPAQLDTGLTTIFSGKLHLEYQRKVCSGNNGGNNQEAIPPRQAETDLEILHVANQTLSAVDYRRIEEAVNAQVDVILANDPILAGYVNTSHLRMDESSDALFRNYVGKCIVPNWVLCNFLVVKLTFQHDDTISSGELKSQIFTHSKDLSKKTIIPQIPTTGAEYVGLATVNAQFHFTFHGVPANQKLDGYQTRFVSQQVEEFLNDHLSLINSEVFSVLLENQVFVENRQRELNTSPQHDGSLQVSGTLTGGNIVLQDPTEFASRIDEVFAEQSAIETFMATLQYNSNLPGPLSKNQRYQFFSQLQSIESFVDATVNDGIASSNGSGSGGGGGSTGGSGGEGEQNGSTLDSMGVDLWIIGVGFGGIVLIVAVFILWYLRRRSASLQHARPSKNGRNRQDSDNKQRSNGRSRRRPQQPKEEVKRSQCPPPHYSDNFISPNKYSNYHNECRQDSDRVDHLNSVEFILPREIANDGEEIKSNSGLKKTKKRRKKRKKKKKRPDDDDDIASSDDGMESVDTTVEISTVDSSVMTAPTALFDDSCTRLHHDRCRAGPPATPKTPRIGNIASDD